MAYVIPQPPSEHDVCSGCGRPCTETVLVLVKMLTSPEPVWLCREAQPCIAPDRPPLNPVPAIDLRGWRRS